MAFTKKKKRRIVVNEHLYFWTVSGDGYIIDLRIMADTPNGQILYCTLSYHYDETPQGNRIALSNPLIVTPYIVRQAIEYGLTQGWQPLSHGTELCLGRIDKQIDLRLEQNKEHAIKDISKQPAKD